MVKDRERDWGVGSGGFRRGKKAFVCLWCGGDCSVCFNYALGILSG